jgi:hypothetical protein
MPAIIDDILDGGEVVHGHPVGVAGSLRGRVDAHARPNRLLHG